MLVDHRRACIAAAEQLHREREQIGAYDDWLKTHRWTWIATFTLREKRSASRAMADINRFLKDLELAAGVSIRWAVAESYSQKGRLHFHLLIGGVDHLSLDDWEEEAERRFGDVLIDSYSAELRGAAYLAKNAFSGSGELHLGGDLFDEPSSLVPRSLQPDTELRRTSVQISSTAHSIYIAATRKSRSAGPSHWAWFDQTDGKSRVSEVNRDYKGHAEAFALIDRLESMHEGSRAEIISSAQLCARLTKRLPLGRGLAALHDQVNEIIRSRDLIVTYRWVPVTDRNPAAELLEKAK